MIPIADTNLNTTYVSKRIDVKLDRETAILFKRIRIGLECIGAFDSDSEPTIAMALREIIRRVAEEAVVVNASGKPVTSDAAEPAKSKPAEPTSANPTVKPRLPKTKQ